MLARHVFVSKSAVEGLVLLQHATEPPQWISGAFPQLRFTLHLIRAFNEFLTALEKPTQAPERAEKGNFCRWHGREERYQTRMCRDSRGAEELGSDSPPWFRLLGYQ